MVRPEEKKAAKLIFRVGLKVEISIEEHVWFPATIVEDLGNNLYTVEYRFARIDNEDQICRVTVDHLHIRHLVPQIRVTNFGLLEKVDAFYDFGWWSGVITKKLTDSKYIVYFKHTNRVKEFDHLELRPHVEWKDDNQVYLNCSTELIEPISLNFAKPTKNTIPVTDNQTSIVTTTMKRSKPTSNKQLNPMKKLKSGVTSDDSSVGQSKEVNIQSDGQTSDKIKIFSRGKKKMVKGGKGVELKHAVFKRKGKSSVNSKGPKAVPQGTTDDSTAITTSKVKEKTESRVYSKPIVLGLHCPAMMISYHKKLKSSTSATSPRILEPQSPKLDSPLSPIATVNTGENEDDLDTVLKKKTGRRFKKQTKSPETSLAVYHRNGDDVAKNSEFRKNKKISLTKVPNKSSAIELTLQQENSKTVKGKRGKSRTISSINIESPTPDSSKQEANGNSEISVEESIDMMPEDEPLSSWLHGKKSSENSKHPVVVSTVDGQNLTFEKRSQIWSTIESMEVFRIIPQNPHFQPLNTLKESARERQAIALMVNFSGVFEDTSRLRLENTRTEIEDHLETLCELESHGFNVNPIRNRLIKLLSVKDEEKTLETRSKEVGDKIEVDSVKSQQFNREIESVDEKVNVLLEKRGQFLKKKEKMESEIAGLKAELEGIEAGLREARSKFDELVATPL